LQNEPHEKVSEPNSEVYVYAVFPGARLLCIVTAVLDVRKPSAGIPQGCYKPAAGALLTF